MGIAFETFVWLWALLVALGRTCKVSEEFLTSFSAFLDKFNAISVIFLFYCSQCSKMVGYGRIWWDIVRSSKICWDMLGYVIGHAGIFLDMLGHAGIF